MKRATRLNTAHAIQNWVEQDRLQELLKASLMIPKKHHEKARKMLKRRISLIKVLNKFI